MNIAIDFDNTFTADPVLWIEFVKKAKQLKHSVYCVTARRDTEENREDIESTFNIWEITLPVFYTSLSSKTWHMEQLGIKIDIWIDDDPHTLVNGH